MPSYPANDLTALESALRQHRSALAAALHDRTHQADAPDEMALANYFQGDEDRAEAASMNDTNIAQLTHDAHTLAQVDAALERIADGSYGLCAACGLAIAPARLRAEPAAALCLVCQTQAEQAPGSR